MRAIWRATGSSSHTTARNRSSISAMIHDRAVTGAHPRRAVSRTVADRRPGRAMAHRRDLVIVGMGSGGIVAAELAATIGVRVTVVERDRVGGDCLWTGCVPSKTLLASAKAAHTMRVADRYGLPCVDPDVDTALVWKRIRAVQQDAATTDEDPA